MTRFKRTDDPEPGPIVGHKRWFSAEFDPDMEPQAMAGLLFDCFNDAWIAWLIGELERGRQQ